MKHKTILYVFDEAAGSRAILAALQATGCNVVSTNRSTQAIALLFAMHCVAAVVLNYPAREQASFDEARSLRAVCPHVPIVLLRHDPIDRLPVFVDDWVSTRQPLEKLTCAMRRLLHAKSFECTEHRSDREASNRGNEDRR